MPNFWTVLQNRGGLFNRANKTIYLEGRRSIAVRGWRWNASPTWPTKPCNGSSLYHRM